jgi:beta-barrel assembly-enhancing protease
MNIETQAIFFDGNSSTPFQVGISINEFTKSIIIKRNGFDDLQWNISDINFENNSESLSIHCKHDSFQIIKITDSNFISEFLEFLKANKNYGWYNTLLNKGLKMYIGIALGILGLLVLAYFYLIPWVGEKAVILVPEDFDNTMGSSFIEEFLRFNTIDSAKTIEAQEFANKLHLNNTKKITITVIKSEIVNAFALPDGNIIIYTGILKDMNSYEELAGLIGHEASHVNNRHSMKMLCRNLSGYILISAVLSDVNGIMAVIGDNVNSLQNLSYSREFEYEADEDGMQLMLQNKINPRGMIALLSSLETDNTYGIPEFLSTHPVTKERINHVNSLIKVTKCAFVTNKDLQKIFTQIKK